MLTAALLASIMSAPPAIRYVEEPGRREFTGQLIVRPKRGLDVATRTKAIARLAGATVKSYPEVDEFIIDAAAIADLAEGAGRGSVENAAISQLMSTGDYQYVEPNYRCYPVVVPNDPYYNSQWHHPKVQSPAAWNLITGNTSIVIAVTDTGVDLTHPDLQNRVPGFNSATDLAEVNGGQINDINGHGTFVVGLAAARGNNRVGTVGMSWNIKFMMVRATDRSDGSAAIDDLTQGARWAIENGARSVSTSYAGIEAQSIQTTGEYIKSIGGLYLYAADNYNHEHSSFDWPDVIVVGATDQNDIKGDFSSYGRAVDIFAPGVEIISTAMDGSYAMGSGTSAATPIANGIIGLMFCADPTLTPIEVEALLFGNCDDLGAPGNDNYFGWGRINSFKSLQATINAKGPQPPSAGDDAASAVEDESLTIDVLANDFDFNDDAITIQSFTQPTSGTVSLSVGSGTGGRDEIAYTPASGYVGSDSFTYTIADSISGTDTATVAMTVVDSSEFRVPENPLYTAAGVEVEYYALGNLVRLPDYSIYTPYAGEIVSTIDFATTNGNFAGSGRANNVGAVFTGFVTVPSSAEYTFFTSSDEGSKLYIGTVTVVNNDGLHGMQEASGAIKLRKGTHAMRVEFFERSGSAGLIASIAGGGLSKQVIPASRLVHAVCPSDFNGDGFVTGDDVDAFNAAFELGDIAADFNRDGFVTGDDFDAYAAAFEGGC